MVLLVFIVHQKAGSETYGSKEEVYLLELQRVDPQQSLPGKFVETLLTSFDSGLFNATAAAR